MKDRLSSERPDSGFMQRVLIAADTRSLAVARGDLRHAAAFHAIGTVDERHGLQQPLALLIRHAGQYAAIGGDRFEQLDGLAQPCGDRALVYWSHFSMRTSST